MKKSIGIIIFIILTKTFYGQVLDPEKKLELVLKCKVMGNDKKCTKIELVCNKKKLKTKSRKANFFLEFDKEYLLVFQKSGFKKRKYETKYITISTKNVPIERWNMGFSGVYLLVELETLDIVSKRFESTVKYTKEQNDFDYFVNELNN